ncbi:MAG: hypothetical protein QOH13_50 [Thermoleophilaceae bacterium]|nr:hypothetical protein [Thermoleophilaceae bacterium]
MVLTLDGMRAMSRQKLDDEHVRSLLRDWITRAGALVTATKRANAALLAQDAGRRKSSVRAWRRALVGLGALEGANAHPEISIIK